MTIKNAVTSAETPSIRQLQTYLREKTPLNIKLTTGDTIQGTIFWQDQDCICFKTGGADVTVWKQAIAFIQPQG